MRVRRWYGARADASAQVSPGRSERYLARTWIPAPPEPAVTPVVRALLIANVAAFFLQQTLPGLTQAFAFVPLYALGRPWTLVTYMFLHGGLMHLLFNMLILLFCGRSVEAILGGRQLAILYVLGAYAAAAAHYLVNATEQMPMVGASGAISAVLGAYAVLFGRNRVKLGNPTLAFWVNALWLAAAWIGLQLIVGLTFETTGTNIAIAAHIGGFLVGLALAKPLLLLRYRKA